MQRAAFGGERVRDTVAQLPSLAGRDRHRLAAGRRRAPVAEAGDDDTRDWYRGRPAARPGAAARRACPLAPAADRAAPHRQAPGPEADGSGAPGAARRPCPRLAAGPAARRAGYAAALAPRRAPRVLDVEVTPGAGPPAAPGGDCPPIRRLAAGNPLWGTERIRGERATLGLHVAKRTVQTSLRGSRARWPRG